MRREAQAARDAQVYKLRMELLPVKVVAERLKMSDRSVEYAMARYLEAHPEAPQPESSKAMARRVAGERDPGRSAQLRGFGGGVCGDNITARPSLVPVLMDDMDGASDALNRLSSRGNGRSLNLDWTEL